MNHIFNQPLRTQEFSLRRIVWRGNVEAGKTYYLHVKNCMNGMASDQKQFHMDYMEWCPKNVYANPETPEEGLHLTTSMQRQGYSNSVPLIGILCMPQSELEILTDAVQAVRQEESTVVARYDISARRLSSPQRGINIIVLSDGTTRKVMVK